MEREDMDKVVHIDNAHTCEMQEMHEVIAENNNTKPKLFLTYPPSNRLRALNRPPSPSSPTASSPSSPSKFLLSATAAPLLSVLPSRFFLPAATLFPPRRHTFSSQPPLSLIDFPSLNTGHRFVRHHFIWL